MKGKFEPIAIVGLSAIFPGDGETESFWRDIVAGRDFVREVPSSHWLVEDYFDADPKAVDKVYAKRGAFLSGIEFDAMGFGLPPQILPETDTAQLLALVAAKRVLDQVETSGGGQAKMALPLDRSRVSIILGVTAAQKLAVDMNARIQRPVWAKAMREAGLGEDRVREICDRISGHYVPWRENTFPGLLGNVVAGRVANRLNLGGTNCVTDAACASSFAALSMAVQELQLGHSDLAITGGVDTFNDPFMYMCFSKTPALSPTGDCRPFSEQADGTILGEGVGMFALKRLSDAERDGNPVFAVIRGVGTSSDGRSKSVYAPLPEGQAKAIRRAYADAGYGPETVELVEAHGTGTIAGDQAELSGLCLAFDDQTGVGKDKKPRQWCALGTVKSQIGHTKAAAGAAGLFKATMALHHKILPPTIKVSKPHPKFDFQNTPFYLNTRARPWVRAYEHPRRAGVSSFGFGGSNFHLTLEEHIGARAPRIRNLPSELVVFSAADPDELLKSAERAQLAPDGSLRHLAQTSQKSFDPRAKHRLSIVAKSNADLREALTLALDRIKREPAQDFSLPTGTEYGANTPEAGTTAFIFPGQGSQTIDMGAELAMGWDLARSAWDFAAGLPLGHERSLQSVVFPRPVFSSEEREQQKATLTSTEWAQPAIGTASWALLKTLEKLGVKADCVAGHSFGELTALFAAGVYDARSFLRAARKRGELMAQASQASKQAGAMLAVASPAETVEQLLRASYSEVVIANRNSPRETVLAGSVEGIRAAEELLVGKELSVQRLNVSTAFHSSFVASACPEFERFLDTLEMSKPRIPVYSNASGAPFATKPAQIRKALAEQIKSPVRFAEMIEAMHKDGVRTFIEVGPSSVLTRLVGDILAGRPHRAVALDQKNRDAGTGLWRGLGKLAVAGVPLDFSALWMEYSDQPMPREKAKGKTGTSVEISGAHFGKPVQEAKTPVQETKTPATAPQIKTVAPQFVPKIKKDSVMSEDNAPTPEIQTAAPETYVSAGPGLLDAFAEIHRSTAEAHAAYQRSMAESHAAFLRASEETLAHLASYLTGATPAPRTIAARPAPRVSLPQQPAAPARAMATQAPARPMTSSSPARMSAPAAPAARMSAPTASMAAPAPRASAPAPLASASLSAPTAAPATAPARDVDLKTALFEVVAEKTGYPAEMLKVEMELEADLGIDSIKRVEILSALKKRAPQMQSATPQETSGLRSLGQIVAFMEKKSAQSAGRPAPQPSLM